jgi:hypothetical protein
MTAQLGRVSDVTWMNPRDAFWAVLLNLLASFLAVLFGLDLLARAVRAACVRIYQRRRAKMLPLAGVAVSRSVITAELTVTRAPPQRTWWQEQHRPHRHHRRVMKKKRRRRQSPPTAPTGTQPPSPLPQFVNTSGWVYQDDSQRLYREAMQSAMASTMPRFNPALFGPPSTMTKSLAASLISAPGGC